MVMTDEQKYSEVLKALGEVLAENSVTISTQSWQIDQLKEKLAAAEEERDKATLHAMSLDTQLLDAAAEIEQLKAGAENERAAAAAKNASEMLLLDSEAIKALRNVNETLRECYNRIADEIGSVESINELAIAQLVLASVLPIKGGAA